MKKIPEGKPVWRKESVKSSNDPTSRTSPLLAATNCYAATWHGPPARDTQAHAEIRSVMTSRCPAVAAPL